MKRFEFSKLVVSFVFVLSTAWISASYVLAYLGREINTEVTVSVIATLLGTILTYSLKSFAEKNSRNKYNVKENKYDEN